MYRYIYLYTHIQTHTHIHTHTHIYIYIYIYICCHIYIYIYMYTHTHTLMLCFCLPLSRILVTTITMITITNSNYEGCVCSGVFICFSCCCKYKETWIERAQTGQQERQHQNNVNKINKEIITTDGHQARSMSQACIVQLLLDQLCMSQLLQRINLTTVSLNSDPNLLKSHLKNSPDLFLVLPKFFADRSSQEPCWYLRQIPNPNFCLSNPDLLDPLRLFCFDPS